MMATYLKQKPPMPENETLLLAVISKQGADYDAEEIGEDVWGEPEDDDDEPAFALMTPACANVPFESLAADDLEEEKLDIDDLIERYGQKALVADLLLLDAIFIAEEDMELVEVKKQSVAEYLLPGYVLELIEFEAE